MSVLDSLTRDSFIALVNMHEANITTMQTQIIQYIDKIQGHKEHNAHDSSSSSSNSSQQHQHTKQRSSCGLPCLSVLFRLDQGD